MQSTNHRALSSTYCSRSAKPNDDNQRGKKTEPLRILSIFCVAYVYGMIHIDVQMKEKWQNEE